MKFVLTSYKTKRSEKVVHVLYLLIDGTLKRLHLCVIMPTSSRRKNY